jgi:hypothetical protein
MQDKAIPEIQWFRTLYVVAEDRIRLACKLTSGDSDTLWVTQRMANALVKTLVDWLEKNAAKEGRLGEIAHRFAQKSAVEKSPERRTDTIEETPAWLVHAIDMRPVQNSIVLVFKDGGERAVGIRFSAQHLRRWLHVLYTQYKRSGWPLDLWPDWITADDEEEVARPSGVLH